MIKQAQSILDFLSMFPASFAEKQNSSQLLMKIWDGPRDKYGNVTLPENVTLADATQLIDRGFIKHKWPGSRVVEITDKGRKIITSLALSETSSLEKNKITKKSDSWLDKIYKNGCNN